LPFRDANNTCGTSSKVSIISIHFSAIWTLMAIAGIRKRDDGDRLCPGVDWKGFRGMGNILRHGYHRIDDKIVWDTVKDELPPVKAELTASDLTSML
jgi:hypothetical protein